MIKRGIDGRWRGVAETRKSSELPASTTDNRLAAAHRQRILADASDAGVAIVSGAETTLGAVLEGNVAFGRLVGATTGQLVGTPLTSLVAAHDAARLQGALKAIAADGGQETVEVTLAGRAVPERLAEVTIKPEDDAAAGRADRSHAGCDRAASLGD